MKLHIVLACLFACASSASFASAAPAPSCKPATMTPRGERIPANLPAFAYAAPSATSNDVHLSDTTGTTKKAVPLSVSAPSNGVVKVAPASPLVAGNRYELSFDPFCEYGAYGVSPMTFTATESAPLPATIGKVRTTTSGESGASTGFAVLVSIDVAAEMRPWAHLYAYDVTIDGTLHETSPVKVSYDGAKLDLTTFGVCDDAMAQRGTHTVRIGAKLPYAPEVEPIATTVDFSCTSGRAVSPAPNGSPDDPRQGSPAASNGASHGTFACALGAPGRDGARSTLAFAGAAAAGLVLAARRRRAVTGASAGGSRR